MTADPSTLSATQKNLWSAIVSEALANLKYNAYAERALQEGHPEIARIFQEVAGAETAHGINHLRVSGDMATTVETLRTITRGEAREAATVYPRMIQAALAESNQEAADSFTLAMEQEWSHLEAFIEALENLEAKLSVVSERTRPGVTEIPLMPAGPAALSTASDGSSQAATAAGPVFDRGTYNTAVGELDQERWRVARMGRLREVVFGAQDGLLSTVALVTSLAVAVESQTTILVAGLAGALPGMISMATGALLGSRAEQDVQRAEIEHEAQELEANPAEELAELVVLFQREGMTYREARQVADEISQDRDLWLKTLVEKELGISAEVTSNPGKDAMAMGLAFILGAAVPLIPHFFLTGGEAIGVSVGATLAGLFTLGLVKGRLVQRAPLLQGLEILGIGAISACVGYALGALIPRLF